MSGEDSQSDVNHSAAIVATAASGLSALDLLLAAYGFAVPVSPVINTIVIAVGSIISFIQHVRAARKQR